MSTPTPTPTPAPDVVQIVEANLSRTEPVTPATFEAQRRVGGTAHSAFVAHPANKGAGVLVLGYDPQLTEPQDVGLEIAVADEGATVASTGMVEDGVIDAINLLPGYRATRESEGLAIETAGTEFDPDLVAGIVEAWLARKYHLKDFAVRFIFGPPGGRSVALRDLRGHAYEIHTSRKSPT